MDVTVSLRFSGPTIDNNLARKNVSKERKCIVQLLVVNFRGEVLDENVTNTGTTKRRIALTPHNSTGFVFDHGKVHGIQSALSIRKLMKVDVGVAERTARDGVTADTNRSDRTK